VADGTASSGYGDAGSRTAAGDRNPDEDLTAMTSTSAKPEPGATLAPQTEPQGEAAAPEASKPAGKASPRPARAAQEDRLAAALRANLARRKAATRAQRQVAQPGGDEDGDA
jgi:hypothetical protein